MRIDARRVKSVLVVSIASVGFMSALLFASSTRLSAQTQSLTCTEFTINITPMLPNGLPDYTKPLINSDGSYNLIRSVQNRIIITGAPENCTRAVKRIMITANNGKFIAYKYWSGTYYHSWYTDFNTELWAESYIILKASIYDGDTDLIISTINSPRYNLSNSTASPPPPPPIEQVKDKTTPTPDTSNDNGTQQPDTTPTTTVKSANTQLNTAEQSCVEKIITTERYDSIENGTARLTSAELGQVQNCLVTTNYILPTALSPIEPNAVKGLETEKSITVEKLENVNKKDEQGKNKETLKISGKATPNSLVILYIFSDPLVITTSTDSNGNWQYSLEDPLEPGKHEVYAVVDRGNGEYKKSDPMSFIISTAGASAVNPDGLSLNLASAPTATPAQSERSLYIYIAGSAAILVAVLASWYFTIKLRRKKSMQTTSTASGSQSDGSTEYSVFKSDLDGVDNTNENIDEKTE